MFLNVCAHLSGFLCYITTRNPPIHYIVFAIPHKRHNTFSGRRPVVPPAGFLSAHFQTKDLKFLPQFRAAGFRSFYFRVYLFSEKNVQTGVQSCIITLVSEVNENRYQSYGCVLTGQPFQISKGGHSKYVEGGTFQ